MYALLLIINTNFHAYIIILTYIVIQYLLQVIRRYFQEMNILEIQ